MGKRRRTTVPLAASTALLATALLATAMLAPAARASDPASEFVSRVNAERASRGLGTLTTRSDLVSVARRHSGRMASAKRLFHNANLRSEVDGWVTVAENVGRGKLVSKIHAALMDSASHRDNILWPSVTEIGVGIVWVGETMYVTQVFREPTRSRAGPSSPTATSSARPSAGSASTVAPPPGGSPSGETRTIDILVKLTAIG